MKAETTNYLYTDSQSCCRVLNNPRLTDTTKRLGIYMDVIQDRMKQGHFQVRHIPGSENVADILTKALSISNFIFKKK